MAQYNKVLMRENKMKVKKFKFQIHSDARGCLVAIEENKDIPFKVKRVYYIYATDQNVRRGLHAHKNLEQILICLHGSCKIHFDDGNETAEIFLNDPSVGLYIANNIWREMYDFSEDAILLVLASELYSEKDYIRNYDEFLKFVKENK